MKGSNSFRCSCIVLCISLFFIPLLCRRSSYKAPQVLRGFSKQGKYFVPLNICKFSEAKTPLLNVEIEDQIIPLEIDLGSEGELAILPEILNRLSNKVLIGHRTFRGLKGRGYESEVYQLPEIHIGRMKIFPIKVKTEDAAFVQDSLFDENQQYDSTKHLGRIGWHAFKPFNVLLDCKNFNVVLCDSLDTLKKQGYPTDSFIEAPLLLDRGTIDFEIMTQSGPLRCVLDTGSTWSLLNKNPEYSDTDFSGPYNSEDSWESIALQIKETDFGSLDFLKIKSPLGLGAIIGMDFIATHLIFIDFFEEKIYFSKICRNL